MVTGFKIPDASGQFTSTSIRCYDGLGCLKRDDELIFCPWEAKYLKELQAFSFKRVEPHQDFYLTEHGKAKEIFPMLIVGVDAGRADKRAYVFNWNDCGHELYQANFSIHKKYLDCLPYNPIKKGLFQFEKFITKKDLELVYERSFEELLKNPK